MTDRDFLVSAFLPVVQKAGEIALVVIAVTVVLLIIRYVVLRWRARSPRMQLSSVVQAVPGTGKKGDEKKDKVKVEEQAIDSPGVESLLREQLAALRLSTADAIPESSSGSPMMKIVEGIGEGIGDKSTLGNALGALFRAVAPEAAYEVSATVRPATEGMEKKVISVQVVDRTRRNPTHVSTGESESSWEDAARQAAAGIAGALYPQVAAKHKGPWTHWREPVPAELVIRHENAVRHESSNRLDQALGAYHEALKCDPLNPHLRIRIAMLQERLEMDLGAWTTYRAIADENHRDSWKDDDRRVRLLALYRLAILLGNKRLAKSWIREPRDCVEERQQEELRTALGGDRHLTRTIWWARALRLPLLPHLFPVRIASSSSTRLLAWFSTSKGAGEIPTPAQAGDRERVGKWVSGQLSQQGEETEGDAERRIGGLLEIISLARLEQLDARLRRKPPWRPWRWPEWWRYRPALHRALNKREFSLSAVRTSKLNARVRMADGMTQRFADRDEEHRHARKARDRLLRRWPFAPTAWRRPARLLRPRQRLADRRDDAWQLHYNAACTVAEALPDDVDWKTATRSREHASLIDAGLKQLEEYVHRTGDRVVAQADWVSREDDDLTSLRETPEYAQWASHHLPRISTDEEEERAATIDTTRIAARIGYASARAFEEAWRKRAEREGLDPKLNARWWLEEEKAWGELETIFGKHASWQERSQGIVALEQCLSAGDGSQSMIDAAYRPADRRASGDLSFLLLGLCGQPAKSARGNGWGDLPNLASIRGWARSRTEATKNDSEPPAASKYPEDRAEREYGTCQRK